ncbi:protein kinase domain-containing protein [Desulfovibrio sp. TomC]|uniref:protein kinase domain-containing protein n=1 Tax=Desulfovibrio sp. TomC TaxID=1562888 RepID=UPI000573BEB0|nr:protein kinase [Desulfovibrio sp. TomC]KHK01609.1 serine/threonine protein kinase [Desulfovibrio sp. TomC]
MRSIGKYSIHGVLGRGGMGAVFKARIPVIGRIVALKLLRPNELTLSLWGRERVERLFRDEAALLGSLRHHNLVDVFDYEASGPWPYFVMEFYGESLGSVIGETYRVEAESRRLPVPRAIGYAAQLLSGLARLHHAGVIHRDVKPFNLLVSDDDVLKITDLGLSKVRGESFGGPSNVKVGSPYYAAPEQEDDPDSADARSDLYAVGVTLFRMLTGRLPEWGEWAASERSPELGDAFDAVLERSLCLRPDGRYADARTMAEALTDAFARWRRRMDGVCAIAPASLCPRCVPEGADLPRRGPRMVGVGEAREDFGLDALWRPSAYWPGQLEDAGDGVVRDKAAGLAWVRQAAPYPTSWEGAAAFVAALNAGQFAGHDDWRLPTVPELMTLLTPEPVGEGYCQPATLTQPVRRVWSADRANYAAAYVADVELGYVAKADFCCPASARAVRSL